MHQSRRFCWFGTDSAGTDSSWFTHVWFRQELHGLGCVFHHPTAEPPLSHWVFPVFYKNMRANSQVQVLFEALLVSFRSCPIDQRKSHRQAEKQCWGTMKNPLSRLYLPGMEGFLCLLLGDDIRKKPPLKRSLWIGTEDVGTYIQWKITQPLKRTTLVCC